MRKKKENNMENYSKSEILQMVEEEDVEFIRLQFTDMFGVLKNVAIPSSRLIKAMENRCTIDTASLDGFTGGEECDLYLKPDLRRFPFCHGDPSRGRLLVFSVMCAEKMAQRLRTVRDLF